MRCVPSSHYNSFMLDFLYFPLSFLHRQHAVTDAELEKARLKEQNTLLLQTMDLTWEVTRQQLRDQDVRLLFSCQLEVDWSLIIHLVDRIR